MQKASPHVRGAGFIAVALALMLVLPETARAQSTTYTACYVPDAGAVYMIGQPDTPSSCLESSHVEFSLASDTSGVSDHGNLSGLSDDDHPQYVHDPNGAISVESDGDVQIGASGGTATQFEVSTDLGEAARVEITDGSNTDQALVLSHRGTGRFLSAYKITSTGSNLRFDVDNDGNVTADGTISGGGADVAEAFDVEGRAESYEPGDVLVVSTEEDRTVTRSSSARSTRVVGVYATKPGVLLSERGTETDLESQVPMGVVGVIPTKVSAENGSIQRGDLLVTAETPGHAMKAEPKVIEGMEVYPQGAIIGKALEAFDGPGTGTIEVMVNVK